MLKRNLEALREGSVLQLWSSQDEWQADRLGVAEWAGAKGLCQGSGRNQEVFIVWNTQETGEGSLRTHILEPDFLHSNPSSALTVTSETS